MNTKNVLMFVALYVGILTALTGTGISQVAPAFADKEECEDNDDNNCNEKTHKIILEDNCKAVNEFENFGSQGSPINDNKFTCDTILTSTANGDDNVLGDSDSVVPSREDCVDCFDSLSDNQLEQVAEALTDLFGVEFPADPSRAQILDIICEALEEGHPNPGLVPGDLDVALGQFISISDAVRIAIVNCLSDLF